MFSFSSVFFSTVNSTLISFLSTPQGVLPCQAIFVTERLRRSYCIEQQQCAMPLGYGGGVSIRKFLFRIRIEGVSLVCSIICEVFFLNSFFRSIDHLLSDSLGDGILLTGPVCVILTGPVAAVVTYF